MFIAHLPAGYLATKAIQKKTGTHQYLWFGLLGSIFPDLDLFYKYLLDPLHRTHHAYWIHTPFWWALITGATFLMLWLLKAKRDWKMAASLFFINIFLHLILDSIASEIAWLSPFTDQFYGLFFVPSVHEFWVWNFILHWTFLLELVIVIWTIICLVRVKKEKVGL